MKNKNSKIDLRLGKIKQEKDKVDLKEEDVLEELSGAGRRVSGTRAKPFKSRCD